MNFQAILDEAHAAAELSAKNTTIDEMRGACGFAWVTIDGVSPLARFCRKMIKETPDRRAQRQYGDKGYPRGWQFWGPGYNGQNVDIKEDAAKAFRDVLAKYGYNATVGSRLD